jgi:hypothetical protein
MRAVEMTVSEGNVPGCGYVFRRYGWRKIPIALIDAAQSFFEANGCFRQCVREARMCPVCSRATNNPYQNPRIPIGSVRCCCLWSDMCQKWHAVAPGRLVPSQKSACE